MIIDICSDIEVNKELLMYILISDARIKIFTFGCATRGRTIWACLARNFIVRNG